MESPGSTPDVTKDDIRTLFSRMDDPSTPVTVAEVVEEVECPRRTARNCLEELATLGELRSKEVRGGPVWWRSSNDRQSAAPRSGRNEFSAFVDAVEDYAIFMLDPDGVVASWNEGAERIKEYRADQIVGEHFSTFYTDADIDDGVPETNLETATREGRVEDEGWRVREDGSRFWANVVITAIYDEEGTLQGFTKVTRDMTERREYEQQLRQERDLTEQILETVPVGISLLTPDGEFVRANRRMLDRMGLENSDLSSYSVDSWELYDGADEPIPNGERPWSRVAETGEPVYGFECRVDLPDVGRRWLSINAAPIAVDHYENDRIVVSIDDITEQKERERDLRREYDQTEKLLRTAPIAIAVQNDAGETVMANRRARESFGLVDAELAAEPDDDSEWTVYDSNGVPLASDEIPSARVWESEGPVYGEELTIEPPEGERIEFRVNAAPLYGPDGEIERVVTAAEEITELKTRERQLERRKTELETELSEILDRISDAFFALDEEWRFTHVNERAAEILPVTVDELLDREVWEIVSETPERVYWKQFHAAMERQEPVSFEVHSEEADAWLEFNVYPSETGLSIYFRDVTERVERERELRRTERRFEAVFEDPNILVGLLEPDGTVLDINRTAMEYIDADLEDVTGEPFWETPWWGEGDDVRADVERWTERAAAGEYVEFETDLTRPDGRKYTLNGYFRPVTDDDGQVVSIIVSDRDVTDRREYERALEERERQLSTLMDNVPGMVYRCRNAPDWPMEFVSDACREITGYEPDALETGEVSFGTDIILEADRDRVWKEIQRTVDDRDPFSVTYRIETAAGEIRWVRSYGRGTVDDDGTLVNLQGIIADITERKRLETELRESERRYRTLAEYFPNGAVMLFDDDLVYTLMAGQGFEDISIDPARAEGRHVRDVWDDDTAAELEPAFRAALEGEEQSVELAYEGREWVTHAVPVTGDRGDVFAGMAMVQDITERKRRERELAKYETIVETVNDGIFVKDEAGRFTMVNDAYADLTGYDREDLIGEHASLVVDEAAIQESMEIRTAPSDDAVDPTIEAPIRTATGDTVPAEGTLSSFQTGDGEQMEVGVVRDITDRKERQRRLEESNERLEQFAYAASHDLQEPLRMVSSYLRLIEQRYADVLDEDGQEFLEFAVDGADRMRNMIEGLLEYSRVDTRGDPFEPVEVADVLAEVREDLQVKIAEYDAEITVDSLPRVEADREQLRQVFQNLVDNAIEYSGDDRPRVHVDAERTGDDWLFSVSDDGIGIDPDDADRVFEVFQSLHGPDEYDGTGIGLALCKRIVERHGGDIWVESKPGDGSIFYFTLPATQNLATEN